MEGTIKLKSNYINQVKEINEVCNKDEKLDKIQILISKDVYDQAKKMAQELNTDIEGVFNLAVHRLIIRAQQRSSVIHD